jgi:pimeloyl-ACP methyl ester carboxylesterase
MPTYRGSDGAQLHYDDAVGGGHSAPPLMAIAGGAGRDPTYLGDLAGLGAQRSLIVPHLRGVGASPMPVAVEVASFWRQANDLEDLRIHLGLETLTLIAHSAGTRLALSYAAQFPDRLGRMVLITPPSAHLVDVGTDVTALVDRRRGEEAFDAAIAAWEAGPDDVTDTGFDRWQQQIAPLGYATWNETIRTHASIGRTSFAANRAFFSVDAPDDLRTRLGQLTSPVLVVAGAQDCIAGAVAPVALASQFGSGTAAVIERCGHYPWVEQPAAFRGALDQFLGFRV